MKNKHSRSLALPSRLLLGLCLSLCMMGGTSFAQTQISAQTALLPPDAPVEESLEILTDRASYAAAAIIRKVTPWGPVEGFPECVASTVDLEVEVMLKGSQPNFPRPWNLHVTAFGTPPAVGSQVIIFAFVDKIVTPCGKDRRQGYEYVVGAKLAPRFLGTPQHPFRLRDRNFQRYEGILSLSSAIQRRFQTYPRTWGEIALPIPEAVLKAEQGPFEPFPSPTTPPWLLVPIDEEVERKILDMVGSPRQSEKVMGINLMRRFESTPNIRLLLSVLESPVTSQEMKDAALGTLRYWDVPVQNH